MKKKLLFLLCCLFLSFSLTSAFGHPPKNIEVKFDPQTSRLTVIVTHPVKNPAAHYIEEVTIDFNGKNLVTQHFDRQTDKNTQQAVYTLIDVKPGDRLVIFADCSIEGSLSKTLPVK